MNRSRPLTVLAFVALIGAVVPSAASGQEVGEGIPSEQEIRETVEAFKTALAAGDSAAVVALLHDDTRVYEGGHAETREEYRSGHLGSDIAFLQTVASETTWDQVVIGSGLALYLSEYRMTGQFRDRDIDARGTETLVLAHTDDGWRIRHIHWSSR